ncbi:isoprenyl transferase [Dokdonia sp. Hel_I_53]|uniref:isoprenyl transferase n=1 Tax=Dokdonia sp. Hel_I_53 TaxID=1566287 RepID=UPI00119AF0B5|nr:isoprenyl transferase [Dokdonia sp. Hel_I_53]TVZ52356.1 undecaprenyl diphosphate synthase [Dokdonia sp. Hel_I_53]
MDILAQIDKDKLPQHVAIIMDGNGRWAKKQGLLRAAGHKKGTRAVREAVECAAELGIKHLTLYAFSTENWNRPKAEVDTLMKLLVSSLKKEIATLQDNDVVLGTIGAINTLPDKAQRELEEVISKTQNNKGLKLTLALSYGSREEIVKTVQEICIKVKNNLLSPAEIDEDCVNSHLYTANMPDVDLLIRTSGEQRVSNFLLWQIAYAEFYFTDILWPDFRKHHLHDAIYNYQKRERRFGKTSEQIK